MFTDVVELQCYAGNGGSGVIAWRREKYLPKGGPAGGDGGRGGSVFVQAQAQLYSLDHLKTRNTVRAQNGEPGGSACCHGSAGSDICIFVPCGTLIKDLDTGELLADLVDDGQTFKLCEGGKGGYGNHHFRSATCQAPYHCTPGEDGSQHRIRLELKLIADVGFVGFPNAGKSTLLRALTQAKAKVGAYPFTTLHPNLGFMIEHDKRLLLADIPGLIEGAHQNRGLGHAFLKHVERTSILLFVLDASGWEGRSPIDDLNTLCNELQAYNPQLLHKPGIIVWNKMEVDPEATQAWMAQYQGPWLSVAVSALDGSGIPELKRQLFEMSKTRLMGA